MSSPPRARSGGISISTTRRRKYRSLRNWPAADHRGEIAVRRGDEAHVGGQRLAAADALELALLHEPQQLALQRQRQLADLVEEQRAAVRRLDLADHARVGAGVRAALVAEQLALDERGRQRRAVDVDERRLAPRAVDVDRAREQALAGAGLAVEQHGRVGLRRAHDHLVHRGHRGRAADHVVEAAAHA